MAGLALESCQQQSVQKDALAITYADTVAGILRTHCVKCHHPKGAGPFSLMHYEQAARKAKTIAKVTRRSYMPPWPADTSYTTFLDQPEITEEEVQILQEWAAQKAPAGDTASLAPVNPPPARFIPGEPDLRVGYQKRVHVPGDNQDHFFALKIPVELDNSTYLRAIEFVPENRKLVHHMNGHIVNFDPALMEDMHQGLYHVQHDSIPPRQLAAQLGFRQMDGTYPTLIPSVVNYLPGVGGTLYPKGIGGWRLSRKFALYINDLHFGPSPVADSDSSYFNLYFMDHPPERPLRELHLGTLGKAPVEPPLVIPPGEIKDFQINYQVPEKISIVTVNPHMHLLGRTFKAHARTPAGDTIPLIRIPEWDFRWQYFYTFPQPVVVPAGSMIEVEARMDNSSHNPYNPHDPPEWVYERKGSMRTTDEMLQFFIMYMPYQKGDETLDLSVH